MSAPKGNNPFAVIKREIECVMLPMPTITLPLEKIESWKNMTESGWRAMDALLASNADLQARLDKLVEAAEYMRDDICEGEHDEAMLKLRAAIAAAKGE